MEITNPPATETQVSTMQRFGDNPILRQLGAMVGIAASVALGVAVVLWSQTPSYSLLFGSLAQKDVADVMQALEQAGVEYKIDEHSGAVMVPSAQRQQARMQLAAAGLPRTNEVGFEILEKDTGYSTSQHQELARFQRALEGELSRSIVTLANIQSARVHLATPKQSVFVRKRKHPSASVVLRLLPGRVLDQEQVEAIIHLVASSVPELSPSRVTIVDQKGRLLSGRQGADELAVSRRQLEYTKDLESHYKQRIEDILTPLLGADRVRAEVTAALDFTVTEQTQEQFDPDRTAIRSQQTNEQQSRLSEVQGIPGALTNQPPGGGVAPEQALGVEQTPAEEPVNISKQSVTNYDLTKTISHTRLASGVLRRLSVAVLIDDNYVDDGSDNPKPLPRTREEISRITELVKKAVGFDGERGDSVQVINSTFRSPEIIPPLPKPPFWEQPWFWDLLRQGGGFVLVLALLFGVLRPTMRRLTTHPDSAEKETAGERETEEQAGADRIEQEREAELARLPAEERIKLIAPNAYDEVVEAAKEMAVADPKRVAQLARTWLTEGAD